MDFSKILLEQPIPIYTAIHREADKNPNCYFIDEPQFSPFQSGDFIADVSKGGSVNCEYIRFCAHGNGTHTECFGHVSKQKYSIQNIKIPFLMLAEVVTYTDRVDSAIKNSIVFSFKNTYNVSAIILRYEDSHLPKFSGRDPLFIRKSDIEDLKSQGIRHLLVDLPSIDPENDNGKLEAHLAFWGMRDRENLPLYPNDTITELCSVPGYVTDGLYLLHLGLSPFETDAVPSMPVLFPIKSP